MARILLVHEHTQSMYGVGALRRDVGMFDVVIGKVWG